ncbi:1-aminocyclopropane-1-carboxylate deaminase/D-cysteine desulfhydrase [Salinimonas chungwhensis]|uniref:1-aminocyclopropane-1-carboxylate deaminase/D-cysteine desulfhydrase n=1 Tax=Salinimonas chungwhensis TaxID=265425 RepID=UPI0003646730|nr:pyridoxal-phosphate dependent enzyme [Salinimonas chungwhensis]
MTPPAPTSSQLEELSSIILPSPLQRFQPNWPGAEDLHIFIKRDDLIHPIISGNKWRKLHGIFSQLTEAPAHIVSFGGGFSNHLHALGFACKQLKIPFTAIVRGQYQHNVTPMLNDLKRWSADIVFVTRQQYAQRTCPAYLAQLQYQYPGALIIPEGGSSHAATNGIATLISELPQNFDHILVPVASGATLAGLAEFSPPTQHVCGIAVLKGEDYLENLVGNLLPAAKPNWRIDHRFHFGGYAKKNSVLTAFCAQLADEYQLAVEPVYSAKLFFALKEKIAMGEFARGSAILAIHTGGLQGARN